jgi:hypothetical protein
VVLALRVGRRDPGMLVGRPRVAAGLLQRPAGAVVPLGGLLGGDRGCLRVEIGLHQPGLDARDVVGGQRDPVPRVVHLLPARVDVVAAGRRGGGRGRDPGQARDEGECEGGDADSMHGSILLSGLR